MARAIACARKGEGRTRPNPAVGAVIVSDGEVIGEGYHRKAGCLHAETSAIANAKRRGNAARLRGATIVVTLEPCSKPGRVGACTDAIAAAGIARVFYGCADPNPVNRGRAASVLKPHGIACTPFRLDPSLVAACESLIAPFATSVIRKRPFVTVKLAMSLDGKICDESGFANWISGPEARAHTGKWRERVDAVMVGAETLRRDDPLLLSHGRPNPSLMRLVVTRSGRLPLTARVFTDGAKGRTYVLFIRRNGRLPSALRALQSEIGGVICAPSLAEALGAFRERTDAMHVFCEGGLELARALAAEGLADAWVQVTAPIVIGHGPLARSRRFVPSGPCVRTGDDHVSTFLADDLNPLVRP